MSDDVYGEGAALKADGFDKAVLGIAELWVGHSRRQLVAYDYDECIQVMVDRDGMTHEEALEFMEYNVTGAYMGPGTPIFIRKMDMDEVEEELSQ